MLEPGAADRGSTAENLTDDLPDPSSKSALTRGFLFCDLRGYTAFVEEHGDRAAAELLTEYREIVRGAIAETGGGEIRTEGDSFYIVFPSASAAVRCGLAIVEGAARANTEQAKREIRVGVGIHAGESVQHREGFVGSAVNIAARICALAAAGEVLVSDTIRSLVRTSMDVRFVPRGRRHLKGITEPFALFAVTRGSAAASAARARHGRIRTLVARRGVVVAVLVVAGLAVALFGALLWAGGRTSPDSLPGQLVFIAKAQQHQVYVARPNGTERRRLTPLTDDVSQFVVRLDFGAIAYVARDQLGTASLSDVGGSSRWPGPWALPDFYRGSPLANIELVAWLPSGELLMEVGPSPSSKVKLAANGGSIARFEVAGCTGNGNSALGSDLRISHDGGSVAYRTAHSLWVAPTDGCGVQVAAGVDGSHPAWSPDGDRLAFEGESAGSGGIWVINVNGTGLRQLTNGNQSDAAPTWSPDGAWIAWKRGVGSAARLWVMRPDGSDQQQLPIGDAGEELDSPIWVPDAGQIPRPSPTPAVPNPFAVIATYSPDSLGLDQPIAMTIGPDGHVYVTDMEPSVTVFDAFGSRIAHWGSQGAKPGQFNFLQSGTDTPHGSIAVDSSSRVYVSDSGNNRVQVFDRSGGFLRQFGAGGDKNGQFLWAFDLSVDAQGNVYVLDDAARNLQKFSPTGAFIWRIDKSTLPDLVGHGHDANIDPRGRIVIGNDDNGRVLYLDRDGKEVDSFSGGACDVTVDSAGNVYVAGCGSDTLTVFDVSHRVVGRWQGPSMPLAFPPEFGPKGEIFALGMDGSLIKLTVNLGQ